MSDGYAIRCADGYLTASHPACGQTALADVVRRMVDEHNRKRFSMQELTDLLAPHGWTCTKMAGT